MLSRDIMASTLYESAIFLKYASIEQKSAVSESFCAVDMKKGLLNEYQQSPVIL